MSPDPGNIGSNPTTPQSWNMYGYSLNNPINFKDPTGLYTCEDHMNCKSDEDKKFKEDLDAARIEAWNLSGGDLLNAMKAINAYGEEGVDNGVNIRFDSNIKGGDAVTEVSGVANGNKGEDNQIGQNINVTFKSLMNADVQSGAGLVMHEGSHVADGSKWVASNFSTGMNPTRYGTEINAYRNQFNLMQVQNRVVTMDRGKYLFSIPGTTWKDMLPYWKEMLKSSPNYGFTYKDKTAAFSKGRVIEP